MDQIAAFGTEIATSLPPTSALYEPLVLANKDAIKSTPRKTFSYGPTDRHQLDVYYPSNLTDASPVLIFMHGGGLVHGSKNLERPDGQPYADGCVYANVAHFFTSHYGFIVICPDYRLMKHGAICPSGGQDYAWTVEWAAANLAPANGGTRDLYLTGHSAGAIHMMTFLLHHHFNDQRFAISPTPRLRERAKGQAEQATGLTLRAAASLSCPFDMREAPAYREAVTKAYFGSLPDLNTVRHMAEDVADREICMILMPEVRLCVLDTELDSPEEIRNTTQRFLDVTKELQNYHHVRLPGHNHLSYALGIGTGIEKEEAWAHDLAKWFLNPDEPVKNK